MVFGGLCPRKENRKNIIREKMVQVLWRYPQSAGHGCKSGNDVIEPATQPETPLVPPTGPENSEMMVRGANTEISIGPVAIER